MEASGETKERQPSSKGSRASSRSSRAESEEFKYKQQIHSDESDDQRSGRGDDSPGLRKRDARNPIGSDYHKENRNGGSNNWRSDSRSPHPSARGGRPLVAPPPPPRLDNGKSRGQPHNQRKSNPQRYEDRKQIVIKNIPTQHNNMQAFLRFFKRFGQISGVDCRTEESSAIVRFSTEAEASKAFKMKEVLFNEPKISIQYGSQTRSFEEEVARQKEQEKAREEAFKLKKGIEDQRMKLLQNLTDYLMMHLELKSLLKGHETKVGQISKTIDEIKERKELIKKIASKDELEVIVADERAKFGLEAEQDLVFSKELLVQSGGLDLKSLNEYFKPFGKIEKLAPDTNQSSVRLSFGSITDAVKAHWAVSRSIQDNPEAEAGKRPHKVQFLNPQLEKLLCSFE